MKPLWDKVPAETRGYIHQREQELVQGFQQVAQRANVADGVLREFAPYAEQLQSEGATPITAMRTLLATAHALRTGGTEYRKAILLSLAQQYGVDLTQQGVNPELATVQARLAQYEQQNIQAQAEAGLRMQYEIGSQINSFGNDPANEFFPHVRGIMGSLINAGIANDLKQAYDMAIGVHPEVRAELMRRERQAEVTAAAQRNAGLSVSGAPSGSGSLVNGAAARPPTNSIREALERAAEGR